MLGRMNTAQQAQRRVAVGSMRDMTALMEVALLIARRRMVVSCSRGYPELFQLAGPLQFAVGLRWAFHKRCRGKEVLLVTVQHNKVNRHGAITLALDRHAFYFVKVPIGCSRLDGSTDQLGLICG